MPLPITQVKKNQLILRVMFLGYMSRTSCQIRNADKQGNLQYMEEVSFPHSVYDTF